LTKRRETWGGPKKSQGIRRAAPFAFRKTNKEKKKRQRRNLFSDKGIENQDTRGKKEKKKSAGKTMRSKKTPEKGQGSVTNNSIRRVTRKEKKSFVFVFFWV